MDLILATDRYNSRDGITKLRHRFATSRHTGRDVAFENGQAAYLMSMRWIWILTTRNRGHRYAQTHSASCCTRRPDDSGCVAPPTDALSSMGHRAGASRAGWWPNYVRLVIEWWGLFCNGSVRESEENYVCPLVYSVRLEVTPEDLKLLSQAVMRSFSKKFKIELGIIYFRVYIALNNCSPD